jgi:hypothetical protein
MRTALVVARRELWEQRAYLVAAAVAALLPLLAPLLPGISHYTVSDVRMFAAGIIACTLTVLTAITLGVTVLGRDLADGRIGFYLSRPITGSALWLGKMSAALVLVVAVALIVLVPSAATSAVVRDQHWAARDYALTFGVLVALGFLLLHLAHALGVMARDRSWWAILDVVFFVGVGGLAWRALGQLVAFPELLTPAWVCLVAGLAVALVLAGLAQTVQGRGDLRAGHRRLSLVLWSVLVPLTCAAALYSRWAVSPTPAQIRYVRELVAAPRGTWAWLVGDIGGRGGNAYATFLVDTESRRYVRLSAGLGYWPEAAAFTSDAGRALWWQTDGVTSQLMTADLSRPEPVAEATTLSLRGGGGELVFSPVGDRLAVLEHAAISVYSFPALKLLAAANLPSGESRHLLWHTGYFAGEDELRLLAGTSAEEHGERGTLAILSFDIASRRWQESGRIPTTGTYQRPLVGAAPLDRILLKQEEPNPPSALVSLHDRSGARLAALRTDTWPWMMMRCFLADGRAVVAGSVGGVASLHVFAPDGREERTIPLGSWSAVWSSGEAAPGQLVVVMGQPKQVGYVALVDVNAGTVRPLAKGLRPAESWWLPTPGSLAARAPGGSAAWLFVAREGALVRLDLVTGTQRLLFGKQPRS